MKNNTQQKSDLDYRINRARLAGANRMNSPAEFKNYLLEIGLNKYEKSLLPIETMEDYPLQSGAKIIQFPERKGGA
jgi:hypothetical protein